MTCSTSSRQKRDQWRSSCGCGRNRAQVARVSPDVTATPSPCRVAAPPIDGRANVQCVELVADIFGVRKSQVELVSGEKSREKRIRITGIDPARARDAIAQELRSTTGRPGSHDHSERPGRQRQ